MSPADWEHIAKAIESLALAIAAIVGGAWALFQFRVLKRVQQAVAEIENERASVRKTLAEAKLTEERLRRKATLTFTIEDRTVRPPPGVARSLLCVVHCRNLGNRSAALSLSDCQFTAVPITAAGPSPDSLIEGLGAYKRERSATTEPSSTDVAFLAPGEQLDLPFVLLLPGTGIYLLNFRATSPQGSQDLADELRAIGTDPDSLNLTFNVHSIAAVA